MDRCLIKQPPLFQIDGDHQAACYLYDGTPLEAQAGRMENQSATRAE
jgi:hypothetical protein